MKVEIGFGISLKERNKKGVAGSKLKDYKVDNIFENKRKGKCKRK